MIRKVLAFVLLAAAACAQDAKSSTPPDAKDQQQFTQQFGFWGGYANESPIEIGVSPDRKFFELRGTWSIVVLNSQHTSLKWKSEVVPIATLHQPTETFFDSRLGGNFTQQANTRYAAGITPLGLQLNLLRHHKVQPFTDIEAGFLIFNDAVPVPNARAFNFTFGFGAGLEIFTGPRNSLTLGFKYHHLSNNETAPANPGVDSPMAYVGYSWYKRHR